LLSAMFRLLQWILIFGAFAGLSLRASGAHFDDCRPEAHADACCDHDEFASATPHGPDCPPVPHDHGQHSHHHGECCHVPTWLPLVADGTALFPPWARVLGSEVANERLPAGPVLTFDKPPLI